MIVMHGDLSTIMAQYSTEFSSSKSKYCAYFQTDLLNMNSLNYIFKIEDGLVIRCRCLNYNWINYACIIGGRTYGTIQMWLEELFDFAEKAFPGSERYPEGSWVRSGDSVSVNQGGLLTGCDASYTV